eukprot:TRINITY_DN60815_c0_g1_i1.p1 TRINITY_DN60815_c0_g1~~TRINITY_DN60815_c0_g1_i1.p1  ORF type:complete len:686 (+),score=217.94 TRINITY_DN60815_c0_g1_i1:92-2149(+)
MGPPNFQQQSHDNHLAEKYQPKTIPQAAEIGYHADRGCTDCLCLPVFAVVWVGMVIVAQISFENGDPKRLLYGTDVVGNLCGWGDDPGVTLTEERSRPGPNGTTVNETVNISWSDMRSIAFPFPTAKECGIATANPPPTCETLVKTALKRGICVKRCPKDGQRVPWYDGGDTIRVGNETQKVSFKNTFDLRETVYRCIPDDLSALAQSGVDLLEQLDVAGTLTGVVRDLQDSWPVLAICSVFCVITCFVWLFILRRTVKPTVFATLFILWVVLGALIYFMYRNWDASDGNSKTTWMVFLVATAGGFLVYTLLLLFFCKNINVACDCIEEASKIPLKIKTMTFVPPVVTVLLIPFVAFHLVVAVYVQSSGDVSEESLPDYVTNTTEDAQGNPISGAAANATQQIMIKALTHKNWKDIAHIYNLFVFLWTIGVIQTSGYFVLACCAVFWYWSKPGDNKQPDAGVGRGLFWVFRYHLGTMVFGSLIVAVIQVIRALMARFEDRLRKLSDNQLANAIVKCAQCCLACFERLIKFINQNAYIMTAMCSDNFCHGAMRALFLLLRHAFSVLAVTIIAQWVIFFGKLQVTVVTTALAWVLLTQTDICGDTSSNEDSILSLIVVASIAFVISSIFCEVFGVCVDTVLLSFCHDLDVNNGEDKPYYLPSDLQRSLGHKNKLTAHELEQGLLDKK